MLWGLVVSLALIAAVVEFGMVRQVLLPAFDRLELRQAREQVGRLEQLLHDDLNGLQKFVVDYANWDQMYDYVRAPDAGLEERLDLDGGYFAQNFHINGLYIIDQNQAAAWAWQDRALASLVGGQHETVWRGPLPPAIQKHTTPALPRLIRLSDGFAFAAASGVRPFQQPVAQPAGLFAVIRLINPRWIASLSQRLRLPVSLIDATSEPLTERTLIRRAHGSLATHLSLTDQSGQKLAALRIDIQPEITRQGQMVALWVRAILVALIVVLFVAAMMYYFRSRRLSNVVANRDEAENRFAALFDGADNALGLLTLSGKVLRMNRRALQLVKVEKETALGRSLWDFSLWDAALREEMGHGIELAANGGRARFEFHHQVADTVSQWQLSVSPIENSLGEVTGLIFEGHDTSEVRSLQTRLHQREKMEALGQLAGGVAHDFNNMLASILGNAELIQIAQPSMDIQASSQSIIEAATTAADLSKKLLAFSRRDLAARTPFEVREAVANAIAILHRTIDDRIILKTDYQCSDERVHGDASIITNAVINLCLNSCDAMPDGGELTVAVRCVEIDAAKCRSLPFDLEAGLYCQIEVIDTGVGIPAEEHERIFEPFFTTKDQDHGTGLGLVAVWNAAQAHRGAVEVVSGVGFGTRMVMYLPLYLGSASSDEIPVHREFSCSWHVLVVDDEPVVRMAAKSLLESFGCQVTLAKHGEQAIGAVQAQPDEFDLLLLDMKMPVCDGEQTFYRLRELGFELPILLCTGFVGDAKINMMRRHGLAGVIEKPFRRNDFATQMRRIQRRYGLGGLN
jgi:PAS domain S-box-containing protein